VVTLATLMHEILLTRIFSVTMWYHFAFMAISIAMLGMTVGAIVVFLRPSADAADVPRRLVWWGFAYAISLVVGFLIYLQIPFTGDASTKSLVLLTLSYTIIAIPFTCSGVMVALVLSTWRKHAGGLYAADLMGAALGCIALVYTLEITDAASAVLVVGALVCVGTAIFALAAGAQSEKLGAFGLAGLLGLVAVVSTVQTREGHPLIEIVDTAANKTASYHYARWNSHSRVTVSGNPDVPTGAAGWGLSEKSGASKVQIRQLGMSIDTWAGTVITKYDGNPATIAYLKDDVTNIAHYLRQNADVFVIGVGGGRDVLSALVFNQHSVTGVEVNRDVLRATTEVFGDFAGHIERDPRVTLAVDEARSYLTRLDRQFDLVHISLIDTWAATAAGAFVLTENSLYTVEGWTTFLKHLKPHGVLSVSRWYYPARPSEAIRIASLARGALAAVGVPNPSKHVLMVKAPKASGMPGLFGNGVATLMVSRDAFSDEDLATLDREMNRLGFEYVFKPGFAESPAYSAILAGPDPTAFYESYSLDVTPPTDDRPFFFQMLRLRDVGKSLSVSWLDPNRTNLEAIRLLVVLLGIVGALTLVCVVLPLGLRARGGMLRGSFSLLGFFFAIGLGFMFIEVSEMQRLMLLLGKPTYALSVVLFTLLVGSGLGSLASERFVGPSALLSDGRALAALVAVLATCGLVTPAIVHELAASSTGARIAAAAIMLLPMGFFMGLPFPLGLRAADKNPALVPWLWGINGAASVLCSVLAMVVALGAGISAAFWSGVLCYCLAFAMYALASRRGSTAEG
jgi:SAM-dependent methyltransferase